MSNVDRLRAELALAEAEEAFRQKKADGALTNEDRLELRRIRQEYRDVHRSPVADGAAPGSIGTSAEASI